MLTTYLNDGILWFCLFYLNNITWFDNLIFSKKYIIFPIRFAIDS